MNKLIIELELMTPIIIGPHPILFDALIHVGECFRQGLSDADDPGPLPLARVGNMIYAASIMQVPVSTRFGENTFIGSLKYHDVRNRKINRGRSTRIRTDAGKYKSRLDRYRTLETDQVRFVTYGDADGIEQALAYLPGIGPRAKLGPNARPASRQRACEQKAMRQCWPAG